MYRKQVIFEQITLTHYPILKYFLWRNRDIRFFDNDGSASKRKWIRSLIRKGAISRIPLTGYIYNESYGTAMDNVDSLYGRLLGDSILAKGMIRVYGNADVELAYKKQLVKELSVFYYINSYLHEEERKVAENEAILFVSHAYQRLLKTVKESDIFFQSHERVNVFDYAGIFHGIRNSIKKFNSWFSSIGMVVFYSLGWLVSRKRSHPSEQYQYAVPIHNPDYQFKFSTRSVDFLLDGVNINRNNTVFLLATSSISKDNLDEINAKGLKLLDCSRKFIPFSGTTAAKMNVLRMVLPYIIIHFFAGLFGNRLVIEVNRTLLFTYLKWSAILSRLDIKNYITLSDEGIIHIGRNIILNQRGITTWYYAYSGSLGYVLVPRDSDVRQQRHWLWAFLRYDYYVTWNDALINYFMAHPQAIHNYVEVGCLWSQSITDIVEGRIDSELENEVGKKVGKGTYKTVSFFDTSYVPDSTAPLQDGITFYRSILNLAEKFPDIFIIVKEKKSVDNVISTCELHGGINTVQYREYKSSLAELRRHSRCHLTGYKGDPSEIIAASDLTVTLAFSSSTIEALCARKRAIFYDVGNRYRSCRYDGIPNLIAHDYDELERLVCYWLYEVSEEEFVSYLETHIKGEMDPYLDGKAVTRFRNLLTYEQG
ncbi:MAG: polysaccharide biosynthesis PFTS motif protein [Planctomycetes bacterium]|nr:polysaccharide biosynthesis PFTS motif protein [Planctomycetota bacterium]